MTSKLYEYIFSLFQLYIFGSRMSKVDLVFMLKENDKVQLEMEPLDDETKADCEAKYGCQVGFKATLIWVGPLPKLDMVREEDLSVLIKRTKKMILFQNCDDFPHHFKSVVKPFLEKRGMDCEFFTRLIKGEIPPKSSPAAVPDGLA